MHPISRPFAATYRGRASILAIFSLWASKNAREVLILTRV